MSAAPMNLLTIRDFHGQISIINGKQNSGNKALKGVLFS